LAEGLAQPVETKRHAERPCLSARYITAMVGHGEATVNKDKDDKPQAPVLSGEPERELERKLKQDPDDDDAKVDVGSDESMDASDPPAASQPGQSDDPVPSSGFPQ
jgi:hypothetical protein